MFVLKATQQVAVEVSFTDKKGNPAPVDGIPVWSASDDITLTVEAAADGMSALVKAKGPVGTAQVNCEADADLGSGTVPVIGTLEIEVVAGDATVVSLNPQTPEEQP